MWLILASILPIGFNLLAAFSASLAGVILTAIVSGKGGLKELFGGLLIWRASVRWWAIALLAVALMYLGAMVLGALFAGSILDLSNAPPVLYMVVPVFIIKILGDAGLAEELGWRGFLPPRLQARYSALVSSIIVGIVWGLWHWPMCLVEGLAPYYDLGQAYGVIPAVLGHAWVLTVPWAIVYTWSYNNTKGSVLIAGIFHSDIPVWALFFGIVGEGIGVNLPVQLWYVGLVALTVLAIVAAYGPAHLSRTTERQMA
jgi:membrane protease YdiL (CAAX protease family)